MALVEVTRDDKIATLTLNRPELRNALSVEMCDEIAEAIGGVSPADARVIVVKGNGKAFCAGADFAAVSGPGGLGFLPRFENMLETVLRHPLPTIAQIHGAALGGGFQLACVCDFRIASETASIGIPAAQLGIVVNVENVRRLVHLTGAARAKRLLMTGHIMQGVTAAKEDLVDRWVADDELEAEVSEFATSLARLAPLSVQGHKRSVQAVVDEIGDVRGGAGAGALDRLVADAYNSEDLQEGLKALTEKRPPEFDGR